jgi:hypothetical protein
MKKFNAILRYSLIFMVVVAIAITYVYRHQLFPAFFVPHHVDNNDQSVTTASTDKQIESATTDTSQAITPEQIQQQESQLIPDTKKTDAIDMGQAKPAQDVADSQQTGIRKRDTNEIATTDQDKQSSPSMRNPVKQATPPETEVASQSMPDPVKQATPPETEVASQSMPDPVKQATPPETEVASQSMPDPVKQATPPETEVASQSIPDPVKQATLTEANTTSLPTDASAQTGKTNERATMDEAQDNASQQQRYLELLNNGRQAYWQGQYEQAVNSYQQAAELQPDNPDIYGELGNVYYRQGDWENAGESFYQAAVRLIKLNRPDRAAYMLSIISGLKKERATELQEQLNQLQQR